MVKVQISIYISCVIYQRQHIMYCRKPNCAKSLHIYIYISFCNIVFLSFINIYICIYHTIYQVILNYLIYDVYASRGKTAPVVVHLFETGSGRWGVLTFMLTCVTCTCYVTSWVGGMGCANVHINLRHMHMLGHVWVSPCWHHSCRMRTDVDTDVDKTL